MLIYYCLYPTINNDMCKANPFPTYFCVFLLSMAFLALYSPALAEENNTESQSTPMTEEPSDPPASFLPSDPDSDLPPIEIESLQPITNQGDMPVVNPYTNEIMDQETYQKMKQKEQGWWPQTYPILIDVAIGAGAGILACSIYLTVRKKRRNIKIEKSKQED